jgi:hypothetical protein
MVIRIGADQRIGHSGEQLCGLPRPRRKPDQAVQTQLASDRTSCRSANANQILLILHTAAFWLMWRIQRESEYRRVRNPAPRVAQGRRPCHGNRNPHPRRIRMRLSRCRHLTHHRQRAEVRYDLKKRGRAAERPRPSINLASPSNHRDETSATKPCGLIRQPNTTKLDQRPSQSPHD